MKTRYDTTTTVPRDFRSRIVNSVSVEASSSSRILTFRRNWTREIRDTVSPVSSLRSSLLREEFLARVRARCNVATIFLFRKKGEALWSENICRTRSNFFLARRETRFWCARAVGKAPSSYNDARPRHTKVSSINLSLKFVLLPVHVHTPDRRVCTHPVYIYAHVYLSRPVLRSVLA